MKTKMILSLCLLMGIVTLKGYGQLPPIIPDGTKSIVWSIEFPDWAEYVSCNGVEDILVGDITVYETDLFKNGEIIRGIAHIQGKLTSARTGEVFGLHEIIKGYLPLNQDGNYTNGSWHFNIVGKEGSHYIGSFSFFEDGTVIMNKAVCH